MLELTVFCDSKIEAVDWSKLPSNQKSVSFKRKTIRIDYYEKKLRRLSVFPQHQMFFEK